MEYERDHGDYNIHIMTRSDHGMNLLGTIEEIEKNVECFMGSKSDYEEMKGEQYLFYDKKTNGHKYYFEQFMQYPGIRDFKLSSEDIEDPSFIKKHIDYLRSLFLDNGIVALVNYDVNSRCGTPIIQKEKGGVK